jgi:hypothetical protein
MQLFAQFQPKNEPDIDPALVPVLIGVVCVFLAIALAVGICFLLSMSKALSRCKPRNRTMEPGMVWLNLVPCLNIVWQFLTVIRVSDSLKNEFYDRGWDDRGDFGKGMGIAALCLNIAGSLPIPILQLVLALASLVCFIMYWVKVAGYSKELAGGGGSSRDYDDDYDRPKKRRKRDDDDDDYDSR